MAAIPARNPWCSRTRRIVIQQTVRTTAINGNTCAGRGRKRPDLRRVLLSAPWSGITHTEFTCNPRGALQSGVNDGARQGHPLSHKDYDMNDGSRGRARPGGVLAAVVAGAALLVAACGGGGSPAVAGSTKYQKAVAYAQCLRSHGEPGFPDPNSQGNFVINGKKDHLTGMGSAQMQSATKACKHFLPNGGQETPAQLKKDLSQALKFVACMRSHGIPDMPDPVVQDGGVVIHGGGFGPNSPQNKSARQACNSLLTGLGGGS
jgi:hypothetical protein